MKMPTIDGINDDPDFERCEGYYAEGWREGCETCLRRLADRPAGCKMIQPPAIIAFWCEYLIEEGYEDIFNGKRNFKEYYELWKKEKP